MAWNVMMFVPHFTILAIQTKNSLRYWIFTQVCKLTNWQTSPDVASYYRDDMVRYPRCFTPVQNYAQYTKKYST